MTNHLRVRALVGFGFGCVGATLNGVEHALSLDEARDLATRIMRVADSLEDRDQPAEVARLEADARKTEAYAKRVERERDEMRTERDHAQADAARLKAEVWRLKESRISGDIDVVVLSRTVERTADLDLSTEEGRASAGVILAEELRRARSVRDLFPSRG